MPSPNSSPLLNDLEADLESLFDPEFEDEFIPYNFDDSLFGGDDFDDFGMNPAPAPGNSASPVFDSPFFDALPRVYGRHSYQQERPTTATSSEYSPPLPASPSYSLPPPSNQQALHSPAAAPRPSRRRDSPQFFDEFYQLTPSPPRMSCPNIATRSSSVIDLTSSPVQSNREMPPVDSRKRKREAPSTCEGASKATKAHSTASTNNDNLSNISLVDLSGVETDEQYEDFKAREAAREAKEQENLINAQIQAEANKPVRLANFQCIICMDNPTDLTITHCGHLFCSECLHSALYAGDKKCCPVCRTVINTKPGAGKSSKNGVFALEMKLLTRNKKGKQKAGAQ